MSDLFGNHIVGFPFEVAQKLTNCTIRVAKTKAPSQLLRRRVCAFVFAYAGCCILMARRLICFVLFGSGFCYVCSFHNIKLLFLNAE